MYPVKAARPLIHQVPATFQQVVDSLEGPESSDGNQVKVLPALLLWLVPRLTHVDDRETRSLLVLDLESLTAILPLEQVGDGSRGRLSCLLDGEKPNGSQDCSQRSPVDSAVT